MSDSAIIIAELTASAADARERAADAAAWLLQQRIIASDDQPDPLRNPSQYLPGSAVTTAAPDFDQNPRTTNSGIDILDERQVHDPGGNYTPPTCPTCAASLDEEIHIALIEPWLDDAEPLVTCRNCKASALPGDWQGLWAIYVANLAVQFNNWPPLSDTFVDQLREHLGPRCRMIHRRI